MATLAADPNRVRETADPHRKKLIRRLKPDYSQRIRHAVQAAFAMLNGWLGIQFYLWVRYYERGATGFYVPRPAGVEGWLPIAGLMNTKYLFITGQVPPIHPAAMYLFLCFLLISILLKKAFCSWLCPVGTLSESMWRLGRWLFKGNLRLPRWLDLLLRSLKHVLLALFVIFIGFMSADTLSSFMETPYGLMVDVRMMNFFRDLSSTAIVIFGALLLMSMLIENFWCRYLCPYGALLGIGSLLSPARIRRDQDACIDCAKCARVCPSHLPVDQLVQIRSVECNACMACVAVCPAQDALQFALPPSKAPDPATRWRRTIGPLAAALVMAYIFFGAVLLARSTNHWQTNLPRSVYMQFVPLANELNHPGM